jgi:hypothetical protein
MLLAENLAAQSVQVTEGAKALSQAMQSTAQARLGIEASIQKGIEQGKATEKVLECSRTQDLAFVSDAYAQAIDAALSGEEMQVATEFFSSPAGKAYLEYSRSLEFKQKGIPDPNPKTLSAAEERATRKFLGASAGKKLLEDRVLETPQLRASLTRGMSDLISKCSKA